VIRAQVPNRDGRLRPGMFARVRLFTNDNKEAIVIPEEALFPVGDDKFVYKVFLDHFPADKDAYEMSFYYGELLWTLSNWKDAAEQYTKVVEMKPDGKYVKEAAYAAVLAWKNALNVDDHEQKELVEKDREQHEKQRGEHLARRDATRLVLILDRSQPRKRLLEGPVVAHRSTLALPGKSMTAQLSRIRCMRWHSTSEWACDVVPTRNR